VQNLTKRSYKAMFDKILLNLFTVSNVLAIILGTVLGMIAGALPGISATMAVGLLIPLTFKFDPLVGLCLLGSIYSSAIYGGSISAILLRTPGTTASVCTSWDGYPLTLNGKGGKALGYSAVCSAIGGVFSVLCLLLIAPLLAKLSLSFGPPERFTLAILGLTMIISLSSNSLIKGAISGLFGLLIATVGIDNNYGIFRFTFNNIALFDGIPILPTLIGLFSISQAFILIESNSQQYIKDELKARSNIKSIIPEFNELVTHWKNILKSSIIGVVVGIVPGAGASIASYIAYNEAKRTSKNPETFGKGNLEGVIASETSNNAITGGSLIPLLTLGIPGNDVTAILLGGLLIHGLIPGPLLFSKHSIITYGFILSLLLSNFSFLIIGLFFSKYFLKITNIPKNILTPLIIVLCAIGSYSIRSTVFDVYLMFIFGIIGYFMDKNNFPPAPVVLAIILGPMAESEFVRSMAIFRGNISLFFSRPICIVLFILSLASITFPFLHKIKSCKSIK